MIFRTKWPKFPVHLSEITKEILGRPSQSDAASCKHSRLPRESGSTASLCVVISIIKRTDDASWRRASADRGSRRTTTTTITTTAPVEAERGIEKKGKNSNES